jgi:hypothetical protein
MIRQYFVRTLRASVVAQAANEVPSRRSHHFGGMSGSNR